MTFCPVVVVVVVVVCTYVFCDGGGHAGGRMDGMDYETGANIMTIDQGAKYN